MWNFRKKCGTLGKNVEFKKKRVSFNIGSTIDLNFEFYIEAACENPPDWPKASTDEVYFSG